MTTRARIGALRETFMVVATFSLLMSTTGCFQDGETASPGVSKTQAVTKPVAEAQLQRKKAVRATMSLGENDYAFDWVMCAPGPQGSVSVIASDRAKRADYPMVRATVFPDQPPESVRNTMSADFSKSEPRVLWLRENGIIQKTEDGLIASGSLEGSEMVTQSGGNQKPVPLKDNRVKAFQFSAKC